MISLLCLALTADEPRLLRYTFKTGAAATYAMVIKSSVVSRTGSDQTLEDSDVEMEFRWKVRKVASDGVADVAQQFTRFRGKARTGDVVGETDTASNDNPREFKDYFDEVRSQEIRTRFRPDGEVFDIRLPDRLRSALNSRTKGEPGYMPPDRLVHFIESFPFLLPRKPVAVGDVWKDPEP